MTDSTLHFLANLGTSLSIGLISPSHGLTASFFLSVGKEYGDWANYGKGMGLHKFTPLALHDMKYNIAGMLVGFLLSWGVRKLLGW